MTYQVLARKWRPRSFKDMVGQEAILRILSNALDQQRLHHAYLLTGTRGVGKTTIGRILAKSLNCESGITSHPCGTCHTCQAIDTGQYLDLYEIDAASRTKVEDTRELLDSIPYPPSQGRYKVYLIDEVHMLSNSSFNALLKTLEEPPEHVKFILATTDPKRLPITILSRCLQFHLKRITPDHITKYLQHICETESVPHDTAALNKIAQAADGSMRDALSLLDQAIAYGSGAVNNTDVHAMLGSMSQDDLLPLIEALAERDNQHVFALTTELAERAPDFQQVLEEFIHLFHQIAIMQIIPNSHADAALIKLSQRFSPEDVQLYYQIALLGKRDMALTTTPQQGFEMTILRMLAFKPELTAATNTPPPAIATAKPQATKAAPAIQAPPMPVDTNLPEWRDVVAKLELTGMTYALAANCTLMKIEGNKVELALGAAHQPMLNPKSKERMTEALSRYFNKPMQLDIQLSTAELATPVKQQQQERQQQLNTATQTIMQNPQVKKLIDMYDATVEVDLLS